MAEKKILVIDADEFLSRIYVAKLQRIGFEAEFALDDTRARELLVEFKPDAVLLELMMVGGSDGFDFLSELRSQVGAPPVIALSNLSEHEDVDRALDLGAKAYMIKARVSFEQVVEKLREVLG